MWRFPRYRKFGELRRPFGPLQTQVASIVRSGSARGSSEDPAIFQPGVTSATFDGRSFTGNRDDEFNSNGIRIVRLNFSGVHPNFRADGRATSLPIKKFSPTIAFEAAIEGNQSVAPLLTSGTSLLTP